MSISSVAYNEVNAASLVSLLLHFGVAHMCFSPGSRSTPLILAFSAASEEGVILSDSGDKRFCQLTSHIDERAMAFHALGIAKATMQPVAIVVTSGTAVANLFPAIIEASYSGIPLVILTADRPLSLVGTGANQTIDQRGIFGDYVRAFLDLPCPESETAYLKDLSSIEETLYALCRKHPGPIHINCRFDEPLFESSSEEIVFPDSLLETLGSLKTYNDLLHDRALQDGINETDRDLLNSLQDLKEGLVVVGELDPWVDKSAVLVFLQALGWPILPELLSGIRGQLPELMLSGYDHQLPQLSPPKHILHIGGRLVSPVLQAQLKAWSLERYLLLTSSQVPYNPFGKVTKSIYTTTLTCLKDCLDDRVDTEVPLDRGAHFNEEALSQKISTEETFHQCLSALIPETHHLFISNSLSIRYFNKCFFFFHWC